VAREGSVLSKAGISWRQIANILKLPKSTVSDFLRKQGGVDVAPVFDIKTW
jgi:predicted transcriptional regulator